MPVITKEIIINIPVKNVYNRMIGLDLEKTINSKPYYNVAFENDRLIKYQLECDDNITVFEKILFPEAFTIFSKRLPKPPFIYSFFIYYLYEHKGSTLIKYVQDFELEDKSKDKEMVEFLNSTGNTVMESIKKYFS